MKMVSVRTIAAVLFMSGLFSVTFVSAAGYPDSNTAGLWLFDEFTYPHTTLTDASEYAKADLCLMEGGSMGKGRFGTGGKVVQLWVKKGKSSLYGSLLPSLAPGK